MESDKPTPEEIQSANHDARGFLSCEQPACVMQERQWIERLARVLLHQSTELESARAEVGRLQEREKGHRHVIRELQTALTVIDQDDGIKAAGITRFEAGGALVLVKWASELLNIDDKLAAQETKVEEKHAVCSYTEKLGAGHTFHCNSPMPCPSHTGPVAEQPAKAPEVEQAEAPRPPYYVCSFCELPNPQRGHAADCPKDPRVARSTAPTRVKLVPIEQAEPQGEVSRDADLAELTRDNGRMYSALEAERAAHGETRQELAELRALYNANAMKQELERVRGELQGMIAKCIEDTHATDALQAELAAARQARPEPSDEELGEAIYDALDFTPYWGELPLERRERYAEAARLTKSALLGVPGRVPTREAIARSVANQLGVQSVGPGHLRAADAVLRIFAGKDPQGQKDSGSSGSAGAAETQAGDAPSGSSIRSPAQPGDSSLNPITPQCAHTSETGQRCPRVVADDGLCPEHAPFTPATNEPPSPLPEVLPANSRTWRTRDNVSGWILSTDKCRYEPVACGSHCARIDQIDWAHYRAQQNSSPAVGSADSPKGNPGETAPSGSGLESSAQPTAGAGLDERPFCREAPPDSEIGQEHELEDSEAAIETDLSPLTYQGRDGDGEPMWGTADCQGERMMGPDWSVKGWRRAEQPKPGDGDCVHVEHPANALAREALEREGYTVRQGRKAQPDDLAGMPTAWRERLAEIELHARVTRRLTAYGHDGPEWSELAARIEAEERGKR